jgi:hypothetical protein
MRESPIISPNSGFEPSRNFRLEIVRESRDKASNRNDGILEDWAGSASRDSHAYLVFSRCSIASLILAGTHQKAHSHHFVVIADLITDLNPQAFSRRFPGHPQAALVFPLDLWVPAKKPLNAISSKPRLCPDQLDSFRIDARQQILWPKKGVQHRASRDARAVNPRPVPRAQFGFMDVLLRGR